MPGSFLLEDKVRKSLAFMRYPTNSVETLLNIPTSYRRQMRMPVCKLEMNNVSVLVKMANETVLYEHRMMPSIRGCFTDNRISQNDVLLGI
jgi:hypothetical protein